MSRRLVNPSQRVTDGRSTCQGTVQGAADALHHEAGAEGLDPADGGHDSVGIAHSTAGEPGCYGQLQQQYALLLREEECRRLLEDLMRENILKTRECREAQASLCELQMEIMRRSMHVGPLVAGKGDRRRTRARAGYGKWRWSQVIGLHGGRGSGWIGH